MVKVESSNIEAVDFVDGNLLVQYKSGKTYSYSGATKELYESFLKAESKGRFMNESVKGKLEYKVV